MDLLNEQFRRELVWYKSLTDEERKSYLFELWRFFYNNNGTMKYKYDEKEYENMLTALADVMKVKKQIISKFIVEGFAKNFMLKEVKNNSSIIEEITE